MKALIQLLKRYPVAKIVMEATRRYHRLVHWNLFEASFLVAVMNPHQTRRFSDMLRQLAKSDAIDTHTLIKIISDPTLF